MGRYRIPFVSDLHGSEVGFRKFLNSTAVYHPDLLIYGGDIMCKMLVPIFPDDGDGYRWFSQDRTPAHIRTDHRMIIRPPARAVLRQAAEPRTRGRSGRQKAPR